MTVRLKLQSGITLIELILSLVIISIALTGIFLVVNYTVGHSADPLVQHQALAVAESYLEEILAQSYTDPDGINVGETRSRFDDVDDYHGLTDTGAHDQMDNAINNLSRYSVAVDVAAPVGLTGGVLAKKVTVTVSGPGFAGLSLVGYKMSF